MVGGGWRGASPYPLPPLHREKFGDVPGRCSDIHALLQGSVGMLDVSPVPPRSKAQKPRFKSCSGFRGWAARGVGLRGASLPAHLTISKEP